MTRYADHVVMIPAQAHIECFDKRAGREFGRHQHIAENAKTLSGDHRFNGMQFLAKAQVLHLLELGHVAPPSSRNGEPPLPSWSQSIRRGPIAVNENLPPKVSSFLKSRGKQLRIADGPERIAQEF